VRRIKLGLHLASELDQNQATLGAVLGDAPERSWVPNSRR
jgi:hypothetical protein